MIVAAAQPLVWATWSLVLLVSVVFEALFCGLETGIYVMNKVRLDLHADEGRRPALLIQRMLRRPRNLLAVLLIGTNLCNYVATFSVTTLFILAGWGHEAEWLTIAVAAPLLFVLADSVPKGVFQRLGGSAVYRLAWLLRGSNVLFQITGLSPLVRAMSGMLMSLTGTRRGKDRSLADPGLSAILAEGQASGVLTHIQSVMAWRVERIAEVTVADVMAPMSRVVAAPLDVTAERLRSLVGQHNYSRVPLLGPDGKVAGVLDIFDALIWDNPFPPAVQAARPLVLPADLNVTDALYRMQREHAVMAVAESAGKHVGIVTVKDLLEEIVGEMEAP